MKYGHGQMLDGLIKDGLWDVYNDVHMVSGPADVSEVACTDVRRDLPLSAGASPTPIAPTLPFSQGMCAEKTAADFKLTRAAQDEFAINSYKRSGAYGLPVLVHPSIFLCSSVDNSLPAFRRVEFRSYPTRSYSTPCLPPQPPRTPRAPSPLRSWESP